MHNSPQEPVWRAVVPLDVMKQPLLCLPHAAGDFLPEDSAAASKGVHPAPVDVELDNVLSVRQQAVLVPVSAL
jgi:hypothetical protein